jgi:hypothetical protein
MSDNSSSSDPYSVESLIREFREMVLEIERNRALANPDSADEFLARIMSELLNIRNDVRPRQRVVGMCCTNRGLTKFDKFLLRTFDPEIGVQSGYVL